MTGGWLGDVIALEAYEDGEPHSPQRRAVSFVGASVEDDPVNRRTVIRIGSTADWKGSVRVATTGDLAATRSGNTLTASANGSINSPGIDGITNLTLGQLVLAKNETAAADNGIYKIAELGSISRQWAMVRAELASSSDEVTTGLTTYVEEGTVNARTIWRLRTPAPIVLNVTGLQFESLPVTPPAFVTTAINPYAANTAQRVILADSTAGPFTIILPPPDEWGGGFFWVKDVGGAAGANNISIEADGGTIDGGASLTININRRAFGLYSDGGFDVRIMSQS